MKPLVGIASDVLTSEGERDRAFVYMTYVDSLRRAGAIPLIIPPQPENAAELLSQLDGIVFTGGNDCDPLVYGEERHPSVQPMDERRQSNDLTLARVSRELDVPSLGICLGMQVMNVAAGGTLIQDIPSAVEGSLDHAKSEGERGRHEVSIESGTRLAAVLGLPVLNVNSSHHQSVSEPGEGLRITAHAPDSVIEALEDPERAFYLGVQWHPEEMAGEESASRIFDAFVDAARRYALSRRR